MRCDALSDLTGLSTLQDINHLEINDCRAFKSLNGLSALERVNEIIQLESLPALADLQGMQQLTAAGVIHLRELAQLTSVTGAEKLTAIGSLELLGNVGLQNLHGLEQLQSINGDLSVEDRGRRHHARPVYRAYRRPRTVYMELLAGLSSPLLPNQHDDDLSVSEQSRGAPYPSLVRTVRAVLFAPRAWFSNLPVEPVARPVALALGVNITSAVMSATIAHWTNPRHPVTTLGALVRFSAQTLVVIYVPAVSVYFVGRITTPAAFNVIVRCFAYAQFPMLVASVPLVPQVVAETWCIWLSAAGLGWALHRSWRFAALGLLIAWCVLIVVSVGLYQLVVE